MQKSFVVVAVALGALGFAAGAFAADTGTLIGAYRSHHSLERYEMSVGVTASQQPRRPVRFDEDREVFTVPGHYGSLVGVTGDSRVTVLWYRDTDGALRNTAVPLPAEHSYKILMGTTARYEADAREQ